MIREKKGKKGRKGGRRKMSECDMCSLAYSDGRGQGVGGTGQQGKG